jgi:uncharacterized protein YeaO (DUF488 family)
MAIHIKRIYEPPAKTDGYRILVDHLWPRGLSKTEVHIDKWLKDIAPSADLRKWFGHKTDKWKEFTSRYQAELKNNPAMDELQKDISAHKTVTLLYAAKDEEHNHALALQQYLEKAIRP